MREAEFYESHDDGSVDCVLCPHRCCRIAEGHTGRCRVRKNVGGRLRSLIYGEVASAHVDPIEKKPLYHFHPGSRILSIGTWGCNFGCVFCQNWEISQETVATQSMTAGEVSASAGRDGSIGVAYTYNEPSVWYEFVVDCAQRVKEAGLKNVLVTNGFINPEPADRWLPFIDALNIDIKSMDDAFYRRHCGGRLGPVLASVVQAKRLAHVEITNLIINGLNDTEDDFERLARWIAEHLGRETPLHLSACFPRYRLKTAATTSATLERAHAICLQHLDYVYLGNVNASIGRDTLCRSCGAVLVSRRAYGGRIEALDGPSCRRCGAPAHVVAG
jgi:pyruvate formate lyase activating enzyme